MLKKIWNFLVVCGESIYTARAAAELSRQGRYEQAKELVNRNH